MPKQRTDLIVIARAKAKPGKEADLLAEPPVITTCEVVDELR